MSRQSNITIDAQNVVKYYNYDSNVAVKAVSDATLMVKRGEFLYISGPSGSGKTTFLSVLGCMMKPTSGKITLLNQEITSMNQSNLTNFRLNHIGFVFQSFRLINAISAIENVELVLNLSGINKANSKKAAKHLLEEMQILHRANFYPRHLSGGEKQRIAIARSLANDAAIILADEPTGSLDSEAGENIIKILQKIAHKRNKSVIVVSHDERIKPFADRILSMEDGKLFERKQ